MINYNGITLRIYTDASTRCSQGISGIAFIVTDAKNKIVYKSAAVVEEKDNNTAELRAILYALAKVKDTDEHITLLTDSSYAINAIRNGYFRPTEAKILEYIHGHLNRLNCNIMWIKGHCHDGTILSYYNKLADKESKKVRKAYEIEQIKLKKKKAKLAWKNNKLIKGNDR